LLFGLLRRFVPRKDKKLPFFVRINFIALADQTFPGVEDIFTSQPRKANGHEKWIDFPLSFGIASVSLV